MIAHATDTTGPKGGPASPIYTDPHDLPSSYLARGSVCVCRRVSLFGHLLAFGNPA